LAASQEGLGSMSECVRVRIMKDCPWNVILCITLKLVAVVVVVVVVVSAAAVTSTNYTCLVSRGRGLLRDIILIFSWNFH
jgi:hypothetical protein